MRLAAFFEEDGERQVMPGEVMIIKGQLRSGFMYPMIKFVAISDTDIFGEKKKRKRRKHGYSGTNISSLPTLTLVIMLSTKTTDLVFIVE